METLDYDHTVFTNQAKEDQSLAIKFSTLAIKNDAESLAAGRPIYADTEMVEIRVRGDRNNVIVRPVREDDRRRFRAAYENFKAGRVAKESGTPLAEWPAISSSQAQEMAYFGFFTVEQVAAADEGAISKMAGLSSLKSRAQAFLEFAKGASPIDGLIAKVEELTSSLTAMQSQLKGMSDENATLRQKYTDLLEKAAEQ